MLDAVALSGTWTRTPQGGYTADAPSGQNAAAISEQLVNGTARYTADVSVDPGTDLSVHTVQDLKRVQDSLNNRPRPTLDLATPKQKFNELILAAAA
jgi:hypothetical protein